MKKIGDVLPAPEKLEGERTDKNELEGKRIIIKKFALLSSSFEGKDEFAVVQADYDGKLITFSGGSVITDKLKTITQANLPVECKLVMVKSKKAGRGYWDIINP